MSDAELIELKSSQFWLKPIAKISIIVKLPPLNLKFDKAISTTAVLEKVSKRATMDFKSLKIIETNIEFFKLEGELNSLKELNFVLTRLNNSKIKLDGFEDLLKIEAYKLKIGTFKQDWDNFFRDDPEMDELKPGHRPDTVHIQKLPTKWFGNDFLDINLLIEVFSCFGDIKRFHIPYIDELDKQQSNMQKETSGFKKFNFDLNKLTFDVYLMYRDYNGFSKAMNSLRGMKLIKFDSEKNDYIEQEIVVEFDKTKHLSDKSIRRRQIAKKYDINTLEDLQKYKINEEKRKILLNDRIEKLELNKKISENFLIYLSRLGNLDEENKKKKEDKSLKGSKNKEKKSTKEKDFNEMKEKKDKELKNSLLEEEKKLREKLIEKKRKNVLLKLKEQGGLKSSISKFISIDNNSLNSQNSSSKNYSKEYNFDNKDLKRKFYKNSSNSHNKSNKNVNKYEKKSDETMKPKSFIFYPK